MAFRWAFVSRHVARRSWLAKREFRIGVEREGVLEGLLAGVSGLGAEGCGGFEGVVVVVGSVLEVDLEDLGKAQPVRLV